MATRRPVSSRARVNSISNPAQSQPQLRSKSVLAKPIVSKRDAEDLQSSTSQPHTQKPQKGQDSSEVHIKVVLRCRGRSEREKQESSPGIVHIDGPITKDLTIETAVPASSLGIISLPPTRTYPFDLVFGPEATQSMIYHDVVGPMLGEVLLGYNCTLFAYGQTGTGKTYTMQGDLSTTPMGNPSTHAGIIPRVLFRLFHELEKSCPDFIVKVSFIELYNEELRDLLANELAAPSNATQPMGMAKDAKGNEGGLKIFDDASKRGVIIQGLEEVAVKDSKQALALLTKGSERRQIAATNFNDHSSRSHSVFSITVHMKEKSSLGDDLLKIGKFNLVDLAGSENIGRSGAENKRAREAGMINQSLLTLGRVINSLVEKSQHVPYRESKLTRLLQDSLGGRTKTCVIATISPARSNMEETLSTLDYALRAKSIRNKPELNQRMTRNSLLKEYVTEIELLKADLLVAREKNGIFISEERWNEMNAENELRETEMVEAKKHVQIIEDQMRNVRDEYDQSIAMLKRKDEELEEKRRKLEETSLRLQEREAELQQMTNAFEEEVVVREAHQQTEGAMNRIAIGLKQTTMHSLCDLDALFGKIDRKNQTLQSNKQIVSENAKSIHTNVEFLARKLEEFHQSAHSAVVRIKSESENFRAAEQDTLVTHAQMADEHMIKAKTLFEQLQTHRGVEDKAITSLTDELELTRQSLNTTVASWSKQIQANSQQLCNEAVKTTHKQVLLLEDAVSILRSLIDTTSTRIEDFLGEERSQMQKLQTAVTTATKDEIVHLKHQNEILAQTLVKERQGAEKSKNELIQRISGLLGDFVQKRDESLRESVGQLQRSNQEVENLLNLNFNQQSKVLDDMTIKNNQFQASTQTTVRQSDNIGGDALQASNDARESIKSSMANIHDMVASTTTAHSSWVQKRTQSMMESSSQVLNKYSRAKRARLEATGSIYSNIEANHSTQQDFVSSSSKRTDAYANQIISKAQECTQLTASYHQSALQNLDSIGRATTRIADDGLKDDLPCGQTPRKRKWQYTDEWALTESREKILSAWKRDKNSQGGEDPLRLDESSRGEHTRTNSGLSSNPESLTSTIADTDSDTPQMPKKSKSKHIDNLPAEPLVDSRKRNVTRGSRRAVF